LQHQDRKWNSGNPADEADDVKRGKNQEYNSSGIISTHKINNRSAKTEDNLENASNPDDLFRECADHPEVYQTENECDKQNECAGRVSLFIKLNWAGSQENNGVCG
jgi:hypothetical protein